MMKKTLALCAILLLATPALATVGSAPAVTLEDGDLTPAPLFTPLSADVIATIGTPAGAEGALPLSASDGLNLFDLETQPAYTWGACSQSCQPCFNNNQCPDFLGLPQKCMPYCP